MDDDRCSKDVLCDGAYIRLRELDKRIDQRLISMQIQWDLAHRLLIERIDAEAKVLGVKLHGMNEFRDQLTKERLEYMTRREAVLISMIVSIVIVIAGAFITHLIMGK
jgi:hypothetical protein